MIYESAGATFDDFRIYRYTLRRVWSSVNWRTVLWIMLNPSTADEHALDPTLRRCQGFSQAWGFDGFEVANLFALRSTQPKRLYDAGISPIGAENNHHIVEAAGRADKIICGWGTEKLAQPRAREIVQLLGERELWCLGTNKDGSPKHPLYQPKSATLVRFA